MRSPGGRIRGLPVRGGFPVRKILPARNILPAVWVTIASVGAWHVNDYCPVSIIYVSPT